MLPKTKANLPFYISVSDGFLQVIGGFWQKEKFKIESVSFGKIPLDAFKQGEIKQTRNFSQMLDTLVNNSWPKSINSNYCHVVLPDKIIFSKYLTLPDIKEEEVESSIKFKVKDFLPHNPEEMYIDWQIVDKNSPELEVSLVAVNKNVIDSYLKVLKQANIYPISFQAESFALSNIVNLITKNPALVIYFTEQVASFIFVQNGSVLFVNTQDLSPSEKDGNDILLELDKSAKYWKTYFEDRKKIESIFVTGYFQNEALLTKALEKNFGIVAKRLPLPVIIPRKISSIRLARLIPLFGMGITQKETETEEKLITLLPDKVKQERQKFKFENEIKSIFKATFIALGGFIAVYFFVFLNLFFQVLKTNSSLSGLEKMIITSTQSKLEKDSVNLNKKILALEAILKKIKPVSQDLSRIYEYIPPGIKVQEVLYNTAKKEIVLKGTASSRAEILNLEKSLLNLGKVDIPLTSFEESQNPKFTASILLK